MANINYIGHPISQTFTTVGDKDIINSGGMLYHGLHIVKTGSGAFNLTLACSLDGVEWDLTRLGSYTSSYFDNSVGIIKYIKPIVNSIDPGVTVKFIYASL